MQERGELVVRKPTPKGTKDRCVLPSIPERNPQAHMWPGELIEGGLQGSSYQRHSLGPPRPPDQSSTREPLASLLFKDGSCSIELDYFQVLA